MDRHRRAERCRHDGTECYVYANALTHGPSGWVIVGDCVPRESEAVSSSVWTSDDGLTWIQVPHDEAAFGYPALMSGVAFDGEMYVAVGWTVHDDGDHAAAWLSADGVTWSRTDLPGEGDHDMWEVDASAGTAVAIGQAQEMATIWLGTR